MSSDTQTALPRADSQPRGPDYSESVRARAMRDARPSRPLPGDAANYVRYVLLDALEAALPELPPDALKRVAAAQSAALLAPHGNWLLAESLRDASQTADSLPPMLTRAEAAAAHRKTP